MHNVYFLLQCAVIMGKDAKAGGKGKGKQAAGGSDESSGKGKGKGGKAADGLGTCTYVKGLLQASTWCCSACALF